MYPRETYQRVVKAPTYRTRFKQWRFYAVLGFVLLDFAVPFVPLASLVLLGLMFVTPIQTWVARFILRALLGR